MSIFRKLLRDPVPEDILIYIDKYIYGISTSGYRARRALLSTVIRVYLSEMDKKGRGEDTTKKL